MKLLFAVTILMAAAQLIQTCAIKPDLSPEEELKHYYQEEVNSMAGDSCLKLKNMSATILADNVIKRSSSHLMQEFRQNITQFQEIFPFYLRFGHNHTLLKTFTDIINDFEQAASKDDRNWLYIQQLLRKLGLNELREKYVNDFEKILPELESRAKEVSDKSLIKWINSVKECMEFECYLNSYQEHTFTSKDHLVRFLQIQLTDMTIAFTINSTKFAKRMLTTDQLRQLSPAVRNYVKKRIEEGQQILDYSENIYGLFWLPLNYGFLVGSFIERYSISLDELYVVLKILQDQGYEELMSDFRKNYNRFLQYDVSREFERLKAATTKRELKREKDFWNTFEKLQKAATFEERILIVNAAKKDDFAKSRI